ncbi:Uncharacterised protein [Mycobacteroides abscessus subsp. abscessus]|nr:Uncharacterised protein [Mycobacteroides abscessus subsp. abscessus]
MGGRGHGRAPAPAEDPQCGDGVAQPRGILPPGGRHPGDAQPVPAQRRDLRLHRGRVEEVLRGPPQPHLLEAPAVGAVPLPPPLLPPRLGDVGHQQPSDPVERGPRLLHQGLHPGPDLRHRLHIAQGQAQTVVVIEHVVVRHDAVEGGAAHLLDHVAHPPAAIGRVPDPHLPVPAVAVPLDARAIPPTGEPRALPLGFGLPAGDPGAEDRARFVIANRGQAFVAQQQGPRAALPQVRGGPRLPGLQDRHRVASDGGLQLLPGDRAAVADPRRSGAGPRPGIHRVGAEPPRREGRRELPRVAGGRAPRLPPPRVHRISRARRARWPLSSPERTRCSTDGNPPSSR